MDVSLKQVKSPLELEQRFVHIISGDNIFLNYDSVLCKSYNIILSIYYKLLLNFDFMLTNMINIF